MLFYSFLGFLTLQIGMAVSGISFIIISILIAIANLPNIHTDKFSHHSMPTNYVVMVIFILVLAITGFTMFAAAYLESRKLCLYAVVLLVITLIIFLVASGISFYNEPALTKNVCFPDQKCPETLWLPRVKYRTQIGSWGDERYDWNTINSTYQETTAVSENSTTYKEDAETTEEETTEETIVGETSDKPDARMRRKARNDKSLVTLPMSRGRQKRPKTNEVSEEISKTTEEPQVSEDPKELEDLKELEEPEELGEIKESEDLPLEGRVRNFKQVKGDVLSGSTETLFNIEGEEDIVESFKRSVLHNANHVKEDSLVIKRSRTRSSSTTEEYYYYYYDDNNTVRGEVIELEEQSEESHYIFGLKFVLAVACFIFVLICLVLTIPLILSYRKQLHYIRLYSMNPSSAHYLVG